RARSTEAIRAIKPAAEFADIEAPHLLLQSNPDAAWSFIEPVLRTSREDELRKHRGNHGAAKRCQAWSPRCAEAGLDDGSCSQLPESTISSGIGPGAGF